MPIFKGMKGTYEAYLFKKKKYSYEMCVCGFKDFLVSPGVRFLNLSGNNRMTGSA